MIQVRRDLDHLGPCGDTSNPQLSRTRRRKLIAVTTARSHQLRNGLEPLDAQRLRHVAYARLSQGWRVRILPQKPHIQQAKRAAQDVEILDRDAF